MFYFEFTFCAKYGLELDDETTSDLKCRQVLSSWQKIADCYKLELQESYSTSFDDTFQQKSLCITITLRRELKKFQSACKTQDMNSSQAVRAFIRDYIKKYGKKESKK